MYSFVHTYTLHERVISWQEGEMAAPLYYTMWKPMPSVSGRRELAGTGSPGASYLSLLSYQGKIEIDKASLLELMDTLYPRLHFFRAI